ncbi:MAG: acireductone synthase [Gammaproteobacteria bacterium]|nr:acireductone synthase [Gammaproteobacteria bacterium]
MQTGAVLVDIEGTTSSISFVHDTLFPHARAAMGEFLREHAHEPAVAEQIRATAREADLPASDLEAVTAALIDWIDQDRKLTPLKALQGMIWEQGYRDGVYRAHMYPDATAALRRWHAAGLPLYVYSSGSVRAQQLFFGYSIDGDLLELFSGHFDTTIGGKREAESYRRIAGQLDLPAADIVFLSDVTAELDAAREAGMQTVLVVRDEEATGPAGDAGPHRVIHRFDEIEPVPA